MNLNKKIGYLLDSGLTPKFISSINEDTINTLYNRLVETKRKETKEQTTGVTTKITTEKVTSIDQSVLNTPQGVNVDGINLQNQGGKLVARQIKETELTEKFESKAQQGLFWAKCNKCKTDDCKWCKMAKEFSKSTSKKQYEKMPEKKHPEKTVKYKKNTNEEFTFKNYFDKVASAYTNTMKGKLTKEEIIKKQIDKIVETNLEPTMKKRELLRLIESQTKQKRRVNEDFYFDGEMEEAVEELDMLDYEDMFDSDEDEPFTEPAKKSKRRMNDPFAPVIEPGIKPKIKPDREKEPEWEPDEDEPSISPDTDPNPQGPGKPNIRSFKRDFDRKMQRMDESFYKPIKYKKY